MIFYPQCFGFLSVVFDGLGGSDSDPLIIPFLPRHATVHLNGYREADTFELDFDAQVFPFSPEMLRSVAVEIFMFQTNGIANNLLKHTDQGIVWDISQYQTDENRVIAGLIDEAALHYGADGRAFRASGRDYTALMIGKDWPDGKRVPVGKDLDKTVQDLVDEAVGAAKSGTSLTVKYIGPDSVKTTAMGQGLTKKDVVTKPPPKVGAKHSKTKKKGFPARSGKNYWDVIYGLCLNHGKICFVRGNDVIISDPHTLTQEGADRAISMAYGRNLKFLEVSRQMGREAVPQIIASSYDSATRKRITAKWPDKVQPVHTTTDKTFSKVKGAKKTAGTHGSAAQITGTGSVKEETRRVTPPPGITDPQLLQDYCKAYYDNLARHEATVHFETNDLEDLKGDDVISLRPGDPVQIGFDAFVDNDMRQLSASERENRLKELGYSDQVASLVANEYDRITQFKTPFYVKDVSLSWSNDAGLVVNVEGINFIFPSRDGSK